MSGSGFKKYCQNVAVLFAAFFLPCVLYEVFLEVRSFQNDLRFAGQSLPYYSWEFRSSDGRKLSSQSGLLKLLLHPSLGYRNQPNQLTEHFRINQLGFRGEDTLPISSMRHRILLLGGSAAFGTGLRSDGETLSAKLTAALPSTEVINAAVIGYQSGQEFTSLMNNVFGLKPTIVIGFDGANDLVADPVYEKHEDLLGYNGFEQIELQLRKLYWLENRNVFIRLASGAFTTLFPKTLEMCALALQVSQGDHSPEAIERRLAQSARVYTSNILQMRRVLSALNIHFLSVLQPNRQSLASGVKGGLGRERDWYGEFRSLVKTAPGVSEIESIDLNDFPKEFSPDQFLDDIHLTAEGTQKAARLITERINRLGWATSNDLPSQNGG